MSWGDFIPVGAMVLAVVLAAILYYLDRRRTAKSEDVRIEALTAAKWWADLVDAKWQGLSGSAKGSVLAIFQVTLASIINAELRCYVGFGGDDDGVMAIRVGQTPTGGFEVDARLLQAVGAAGFPADFSLDCVRGSLMWISSGLLKAMPPEGPMEAILLT